MHTYREKPPIEFKIMELEDFEALRKLQAELHGGTDRERDYGHRLWLLLDRAESLHFCQESGKYL